MTPVIVVKVTGDVGRFNLICSGSKSGSEV